MPIGREREAAVRKKEKAVVIGVDEAGRGPLAGPVVVAGCVLPKDFHDEGVMDSKKINTEAKREEVYERIVGWEGVRYSVCVVGVGHIDKRNILQATLDGMRECARMFVVNNKTKRKKACKDCGDASLCFSSPPTHCPTMKKNHKEGYYTLIDGNKIPSNHPTAAEAIVQGDGKEVCIAAASIIAKVTRDRIMHTIHKEYPTYAIDRHKGYPTAAHCSLIKQHGVTPHHRQSFGPVKAVLEAAKKKAKAKGKVKPTAKPIKKKKATKSKKKK